MDGNNRWSKKNSYSKYDSYKHGAEKLLKLSSHVFTNTKIKYISAFALSKNNLSRTSNMINTIKKVLYDSLVDFENNELKYNIYFIGDFDFLDKITKKKIELINEKKNFSKILIIYLNYGGREDIEQASRKSKKVNQKLNKNLLTSEFPDPQILIRTGGYKRISNFMLYQIAFTELFFLNKLWSDLKIKDLDNIFVKYHNIKRKFGK